MALEEGLDESPSESLLVSMETTTSFSPDVSSIGDKTGKIEAKKVCYFKSFLVFELTSYVALDTIIPLDDLECT